MDFSENAMDSFWDLGNENPQEFPERLPTKEFLDMFNDPNSDELYKQIVPEMSVPADFLDNSIDINLDPNPVINDRMFGGIADDHAEKNRYSNIEYNSILGDEEFNYLPGIDEAEYLPYNICINPRTMTPVPSSSPEIKLQNQIIPKPYHPFHDHDYTKSYNRDESDEELEVKEEIIEDEQVVDVWKIEKFQQVSKPLQEVKRTRRSTRAVEVKRRELACEVKRREQARKFSESVHAQLNRNVKKPRNTRQYKNMRVKNSVETTPSQSDIDEWYSQPTRATNLKITKKKTTKGRIDHSESERIRRTVLTFHFKILKHLMPFEYLPGADKEKISKQKTLSATKKYIEDLRSAKAIYTTLYHQNSFCRDRWQRKTALKYVK